MGLEFLVAALYMLGVSAATETAVVVGALGVAAVTVAGTVKLAKDDVK